jgi:hypothetical protein
MGAASDDNYMRLQRQPRPYMCLFMGQESEGVVITRSRNLSRSGVYLEMEYRPPLGSIRELQFIWGGDTMSCEAQVTRHGSDGIGLRFVDVNSVFVQTLREVMAPSPRVEFLPLKNV